jgi:hypothetical protein
VFSNSQIPDLLGLPATVLVAGCASLKPDGAKTPSNLKPACRGISRTYIESELFDASLDFLLTALQQNILTTTNANASVSTKVGVMSKDSTGLLSRSGHLCNPVASHVQRIDGSVARLASVLITKSANYNDLVIYESCSVEVRRWESLFRIAIDLNFTRRSKNY